MYNGFCPVELCNNKLSYGNIDLGILKDKENQ